MLRGFVIEPLTAESRVTARLLRLNTDKRVVERRALMLVGRYSARLKLCAGTARGQCGTGLMANMALAVTWNLQLAGSIEDARVRIPLSPP